MAGTMTSEGSGRGRYCDGTCAHQHCQSGDVMTPELAQWRSSSLDEDDEDPPISSPYWDVDDNDCGPKPSDLYKKFIWQIDNFSQVMNKKEIRSKVFEMWGYEWYILIYPQGCDVNNYMSLFLCVANHDNLHPGWGHFAQFAVAVVNKDTKKAKFSDTMHRFWKKEHDWGWKKFIELSKVLDGYISGDTLLIKTQVQIVREREDRLFCCLDPWYRRGLLPVYMPNVEQIFRRYVEERQTILVKLRENKSKWSSFYGFWMEMNKYSKYLLTRVRSDHIMKLLVKHFFIEKDVSSTLVMDSLYSGFLYLEDHEKNKGSGMDEKELSMPLINVDNDMFVLVDDILVLIERAAAKSLPRKVDKGHCNLAQDASYGNDLIQSDLYYEEIRLTQIGRRTIELFSLIHIISKIEMAYQEAVAFKRQEELIREEEEASTAEAVQREKRGATEREKKSKKKQSKQKRNNRKGKDKGRVEKPSFAVEELKKSSIPDETEDNVKESEPGIEENSDVSDSLECAPEVHLPDSEDENDAFVISETAISEVQPFEEATNDGTCSIRSYPNGKAERPSPSVVDDSLFTYSTDPVQSTLNEPSEGEFFVKQKRQRSFNRRWSKRGEVFSNETGWNNNNLFRRSTERVGDQVQPNYPYRSCKQEAFRHDFPEKMKKPYWRPVKVEGASPGTGPCLSDDKVEVKIFSEQPAAAEVPSAQSSSSEVPSSHLQKPIEKSDSAPILNPSSSELPCLAGREVRATSKVDAIPIDTPKSIENPKPIEKPTLQKVPILSRPLTASSPTAPIALPVKTTPLLSHSVSADSRIVSVGTTSTSQSNVPRSYRNAMIGGSVPERSVVLSPLGHQLTEPTLASNNLTDAVAGTSGDRSQSSVGMAEEFPHLDIINALFEDEHKIGIGMTSNFQTFSSLHDYLNQHLNLSEPIGYSNETVPSCRFEQPQVYYGNDYGGYGSYGLMANPNLQSYGGGQIDGLASNQRQMMIGGGGRGHGHGGSNIIPPHMGMPSRMESDGFPYRVSDYSNVACRVDGHGSTIFRPLDRH